MTLAPSDMLCFALHSAAHAVHAAYAPLLQPHGLTYPQYLAISALNATDGLTETIANALKDWKPGDAQITVTAGACALSSPAGTGCPKRSCAIAGAAKMAARAVAAFSLRSR